MASARGVSVHPRHSGSVPPAPAPRRSPLGAVSGRRQQRRTRRLL